MLSLGGYVLGSNVIIWALLAPLGSAWGGRSREATFWVAAFLLAAILSGVVDPYLRDTNDLPETIRTVLFVMNLIAVVGVLFLLLDSFMHQKDTLIGVMRRNRELESAFLDQELTLRQNDKLATLGKLSAGLAHELNNPTAAAQQATHQLKLLLLDAEQLEAEMTSPGLLAHEQEALRTYVDRASNRIHQPEFLDPLERSDREDEIQEYLEGAGVDDPWEVAPSLVGFGLELGDIEALAAKLRSERFVAAVTLLANYYKRHSLFGSLDESTARIIEMVKALKSYAYLDQAPHQLIDVHEGLDSTLVMLQSRLKTGVEVTRSYADDLPLIDGYGGELNQVWTNILDNAVDAMDGEGAVRISTAHSGDYVVVELTDNGPGVPAEIAERVFDPFVTTKAPGDGTGLGLSISHNIVTQKHGGEISLASQPGATTFTVRLPISNKE